MINGIARWVRKCEAVFLSDRVGLAIALALFLTISSAGWMLLGSAIFAVTSTIMLALLTLAQLRISLQLQLARRDQERLAGEQQRLQMQLQRQTEALFSLFSLIRPREPLPSMGDDWAVTPDVASLMVALIRELKPTLIVEAGSGVSTLVAAYALRGLGRGTILSLEHEEQHLATTRRHLNQHGLADIATVQYAPLKEVFIRGAKWRWYDTSVIEGVRSIDLVIVDGPPGDIGKWARYPALPLLFDRLSDGAAVLLDDTRRQDEGAIVEAWMKEFRYFELEAGETTTGTAIMRRDGSKPVPPREACHPEVSRPAVVSEPPG
jgi:predicted O-methyltransferase YrrM